jgi:hypothetical protein
VSIEGAELRRGDNLRDAEPLQSGFTDAMAQLGAEKTLAATES